MCGIAGWVDFKRDESIESLYPMLQCLRHRGPDDTGSAVLTDTHGEVAGAMGQTRLAIIDLSPSGRQPMANESKTLALTCNGEIYNYRELRADLIARGHTFSSHSDCEVLLHMYEEDPQRFMTALDGMFAFALWDSQREELLLVRDRIGIKPLYYTVNDGRIAFASEIKSLIALPWVERTLNVDALPLYLSYLYVPPPDTLWKGIHKLAPGELLRFSRAGARVDRYWQLQRQDEDRRSDSAIIGDMWDLWQDVVRTEMVADVPVGVFLSGGLDSGAIVPAASRMGTVRTFSIGFDEADYDELAFARLVAARYETEHVEQVVRPADLDVLERLVTAFDEPLADSGAIANYRLAEVTARHVKVALSGAGGDEVLGGYHHYAADALAQQFDAVPQPVRGLIARAARATPLDEGRPGTLRRIRRFASVLDSPPEYRHYRYLTVNHLSEDARAAVCPRGGSTIDPFSYTEQAFREAPFSDFLQRALYVDLTTYLPHDILTLADRMSMAHSLEVRVPYLNRRFVEFMARVPSRLKASARQTKIAWRRALEGHLPAAILARRKQGFGVPISDWFRGDTSLDLERVASGSPYFDSAAVTAMFAQHRAGKADNALALWTLVMFEKWRLHYRL
jgi:asparagine synthase (glutamine-hydrolysing)